MVKARESVMAVQKRQTHSKSRRGCLNCKKRHVKCDEQAPRCANCVVRGTGCEWESSQPSKRSSPSDEFSSTSAAGPSRDSHSHSSSSPDNNHPTIALSASPAAFSSTLETDRSIELELMHRWSTWTWGCFYRSSKDQQLLQVSLPRAALTNSYLMNGIFAMAAADMSSHPGERRPEMYMRTAVKYMNRANAEFKTRAADLKKDEVPLLWLFATLQAIFRYAMPIGSARSPLDRLNMLFAATIGVGNKLLAKSDWVPPCWSEILSTLDTGAMNALDAETRTALDYMDTISEQLLVSSTTPCGEPVSVPAGDMDMYRLAIAFVKYSFAEEKKGVIKAYCLSVVSAVPEEFFVRLRQLEPVALFIILYVSVLMDKSAIGMIEWWIGPRAREQLDEISIRLLHTPLAKIPEGLRGLEWTRRQVGLPPIMFGEPPILPWVGT